MTDLRKAAEMALEALKDTHYRIIDAGLLDQDLLDRNFTVATALRQALAESANSTTDFVEPKASSQPEQEPVCFLRETAWSYEIAPWDDPNGIPVYTAPPKQEYQYEVVAEHADGTYTTRRIQKREWVGLTDDERSYYLQAAANVGWWQAAVLVENKLKEKNGG